MNALETAPEQIPTMIQRALSEGINADYVLMDSWFTMPPLIKVIVEQGYCGTRHGCNWYGKSNETALFSGWAVARFKKSLSFG